ncbi:hypothetical protein E5Q_05472 [Mixia osmundae IAM 14324]|uniref:Chitin synthase export chaperone n=1 Tax=Mixia osmundae (strain CBS 9802 / IAM 14324 / JCM 22182 / KY 12970) TaxID=764103 RepID=G7E7H4_MIXOS|nr:hypothetical protein E5Q_05472 [Mixia osmundae IAM 14324]
MGFSFGSFDSICNTAALIVCPLLGGQDGIEPVCYSRNVEIGNTLIFQPATAFIHIIALLMVAIMVFHIRSKYTAVGRKEIVLFFYLYAVVELLSIFLDTAIIPTSSSAYLWFAAVHTGIISATFWCLLVNGFVGFQFAEDGTPLSLWSLRGSCAAVFAIVFFVAVATFKSIAGLSPTKTAVLWVFTYIFNGACVVIYIVLQLILVFRTLDDRWPIGDILFGTAFFAIGQVVLYAFSVTICDAVKHYLDGLFASTTCTLLAVMMVYKYWDSITKEDLEFSVGSKTAVWELKDYKENWDDSSYGGGSGHGYPPTKGY